MKFIANKTDYMVDSKGDLIITLTLPKDLYNNQRIAKQSVENMRNVDLISVNIDKHKKSRSFEQNKLLWALIGLIAEHETGTKLKRETFRIYGDLLREANIRYEVIRTRESARNILEKHFRAVAEVPNSDKKDTQGNMTKLFWAYYGSSTFNTKEMTLLVELALLRCDENGIDTSQEGIDYENN
jgi:hypothetical protein